MQIEKCKVGVTVHCPADRGDAAYTGVITRVSTDVNHTAAGVAYVWVTVRSAAYTIRAAVWPSNRLG